MIPEHIRLDERLDYPSLKNAYPFVIFRRITSSEDNQVRYARERWEIEVIGRLTSPTAGDDTLQAIHDALLDHFAGKHRTIGSYTSDGVAASDTGIRTKVTHINTIEMIEGEEKAHLLIFLFHYVRTF